MQLGGKRMKHDLKIDPKYFLEGLKGRKPFEIRINDRYFQVGDDIVFKEWNRCGGYTGREFSAKIIYVLSDFVGLTPGFVAFTYEINKDTKTDEMTIRAIMELLANEKREYLKTVNESQIDSVKQCFMNRVTGMNIALDKILGFSRKNGIDVSDIEW